ncbi:hypothetical protein BDR26DRAFT_920221, partial [Obelidium mucronatum]
MSNQNVQGATAAPAPNPSQPASPPPNSVAIEMTALPPASNDANPRDQPPAFDSSFITSPPATTAATNIEEPPPPVYDGPIPYGTVLLAVIPLEFANAPSFFNNNRPQRLEDKIPNLTYLTRMNELNVELSKPESQKSIQFMRRYGTIVLSVSAVFVILAVVLYFLFGSTKASNYTLAPLLVPLILFTTIPTTAKVRFSLVITNTPYRLSSNILVINPLFISLFFASKKYVRIVETFAYKWTKEDESQGINLIYSVKKNRPNGGQTLIDVKLAIFEKQTFSMGQSLETEALPTYST